MISKQSRVVILIAAICLARGFAQLVSTNEPSDWSTARTLLGDHFLRPVRLPYNSDKTIRDELLDPKIIRTIAEANALSERDLSTITVAPGFLPEWVSIYRTGDTNSAFDMLADSLRDYVEARREGHTRAYVIESFTNRVDPSTISDIAIRTILDTRCPPPVSRLWTNSFGTITNRAGSVSRRIIKTTTSSGPKGTKIIRYTPLTNEVCRWVTYDMVDADICWRYYVTVTPDGSLHDFVYFRFDAKEAMPEFRKVIEQVDAEVRDEMKRDGSYGQFGSIHTFWSLKKRKLKARGIDWRSKAELNPNACFD